MTIRRFESHNPKSHPSTFIDDTALVIGDVVIGENTSVWPMVVIRGDIHSIRIGARSNIQDGSVLHVTHQGEYSSGYGVTIGEGVTVGHNATLHACTIEDYCLIGMGAIVLDGAVVRKHAMVGAGSLVPPGKELEGGFLYVGSPVKKARALTEKELAFFEYSANYYVELKNRHMQGQK